MSLLTIKMVVQKSLREYIHPDMEVINVDGTLENEPTENLYKIEPEKREGLFYRLKNKIF